MNDFSKLFGSNSFSPILISLFIVFFLFQKSIFETIMKARFPNVKVLPSGKFFILANNGIYIYNSNFSLYKIIANFSNNEFMDETDYIITIITEFRDDHNNFYIICLVKAQFLYIFESQREILYKSILSIDKGRKYYNLVPLKMEYPNFHYIISYINGTSNLQINLFHYMFNISQQNNNNNDIINKKIYRHNDGNIIISKDHISCNKMSGQRFICFYRKEGNILAAIVLNETLEICKEQTQKTEYNMELIKSSSNKKQNCFVCYNYNKYGFFCYSYNIDNNTFSGKIINIDAKNEYYPKLKTYYFPETSQYSLIYFYEENNQKNIIEGIVILDENFNQTFNEKIIINPPTLIESEFSFIYSFTHEEYILFYDENSEIKYTSSIYKTNYTNYYSSINYLFPSTSIISSYNNFLIFPKFHPI